MALQLSLVVGKTSGLLGLSEAARKRDGGPTDADDAGCRAEFSPGVKHEDTKLRR